ncbi:ABC transporter permease subunit [Bacillus sp. DJP31]|uniref:ABC transporter permease subunit n=1 Tax=Bacillus sp. DJP31 TaxID=3409789 RepID=UPI003BB75558
MIQFFLKKPKFVIAFLFLFTLLLTSLLYEPLFGDKVFPNRFIFDKEGTIIGSSPFSPSEYPPFGTDRAGVPLLAKIIEGAKYTIITALIISTLQVLLSFILSIFYSRLPKLLQRGLEGIVESSLYLPASIIAFMLLAPLQFYLDPNVASENFLKLLSLQIIILTLIGIPQLVILFTKDIQKVLNEEYITASKTLGAHGLRLYKKHIIPFMVPRLLLQFSQRTVEVLILLVHLGFLFLFLGGYVMVEVFDGESQPFSLSNEWAGEIGKHFRGLSITPWEVYSPLLFFALTVLSFNMITNSIHEYINSTEIRRKKVNKKRSKEQEKIHSHKLSKERFVFIEKRTSNF